MDVKIARQLPIYELAESRVAQSLYTDLQLLVCDIHSSPSRNMSPR